MSGVRVGIKDAKITAVSCRDDEGKEYGVELFLRKTARRWWGRKYTYEVPIRVGDSVAAGDKMNVRVVGDGA